MRRSQVFAVVSVALSMALVACGGAGSTEQTAPDAPNANGGACSAVMTHETPLEAASHVPQDSELTFGSNPPSSGAHYPTPAEWAINYPIVIARGNYLHNEEHGGVVLLYNCPDGGCPDVSDGLAAIGQALPQDPQCVGATNGEGPVNARWLVTPDPFLPDHVQVAAAAWGWTYRATCFDPDTLGAFIAQRYAQGGSDRENCKAPDSPLPSM